MPANRNVLILALSVSVMLLTVLGLAFKRSDPDYRDSRERLHSVFDKRLTEMAAAHGRETLLSICGLAPGHSS